MTRNRTFITISCAAVSAALLFGLPAEAGVEHQQVSSFNQITQVSNDDWQPDGFVNGTPILATWVEPASINVDGLDGEPAWASALETEIPLTYGEVDRVWIKALYTNDEVFIRLRWPDSTENRQHHPWTWQPEQGRYVAGTQAEDSVMLSFEAGCEWTPSILGGYIYDFDAWHWMAARSDPQHQAVDLYGNVQDRQINLPGFVAYPSRVTEKDWILKFTENHDVDLHNNWDELDRVYMMQPVTKDLWVRAVPDGGRHAPEFVEQLSPPETAPEAPGSTFPQFSALKLSGGAGEVSAKGQWKDGYWTVEFSRVRETPVANIYDVVFNRLIQFSVHVFDQVDQLDQASESGRLFLRFMPAETLLKPDDKLLTSE